MTSIAREPRRGYDGRMSQYVTFERRGMFPALFAVQGDGRLTWELASPGEVDGAVRELKRQIDVEARRLKMELQRHVEPFGNHDAQGS